MLDTNTCVNYIRFGPASKVTPRLAAAPPGSVFLCSVVVGELLYGAYHSLPPHQAANLAPVGTFRAGFGSLPMDDAAADQYGRLRAHLAGTGQLIGPNDLLSAAIALANGLILVTHNTKEFSRAPGLPLEDWV